MLEPSLVARIRRGARNAHHPPAGFLYWTKPRWPRSRRLDPCARVGTFPLAAAGSNAFGRRGLTASQLPWDRPRRGE